MQYIDPKKINQIYMSQSKYSKIPHSKKKLTNALNTVKLKASNILMKNYHLVPERHQCPGSFQEVRKNFQKSEIAAVIYFQMRMREKFVRTSFWEHVVLKRLKELCKKVLNKLNALTRITPCLDQKQIYFFYNSFLKGQSSYYPLIWTSCLRRPDHLIIITRKSIGNGLQ